MLRPPRGRPGMQDAELPVVQDSAPVASVASQDGPAQPQGAEAATPSPLAGLAAAAEATLENWSTVSSPMSMEYALRDLHRQTKCVSRSSTPRLIWLKGNDPPDDSVG